ncbi:hypothetical protein [Viridibacterium curvum]|uniref:PilN domain-containing protein n=1 Tax=Viridibacterium curvum TaxID=1101404 RepID=A0ABP9QLC9_9RHOO
MFLFRQIPPAFTLDFVARRPSPSLSGWLLLLAGLLSAAAALFDYDSLAERRDELAAQVARQQRAADRQTARLPRSNVRNERGNERNAATERQAAWRVAGALSTPWQSLLPMLEAAGNNDVSLLALDADNGKTQISIEGDARSLEAVFAYAERLGNQPAFASVQVQNYQFQKRGAVEVVHFRLTTRWSKGS